MPNADLRFHNEQAGRRRQDWLCGSKFSSLQVTYSGAGLGGTRATEPLRPALVGTYNAGASMIGGPARSAVIPFRHRWAHSLPSWRMEVRERVQDIGPLDVRDYLAATKANGLPTAALKQHSAAIRMLFDHLVTGGLIEHNSALWDTLEKARQMAVHASTRTTQIYDRREDRVTLDEVVKINIRG